MEFIYLIAVVTIMEAVGQTAFAYQDINGLRRDFHAEASRRQRHLSSSSLIRKKRFFDDDDLEDAEKYLGEKIGKVCPAAKHWFDTHEGGGHPGSHKTLGHGGGQAIHWAIRIRRLKKAIEVLCREPTTHKPHKPHKPRPTHSPSHSPSASVPYLGGGFLPDRLAQNLEIRRYVIWPLRQWFGWPAGALASAFLLQ